MKKSLIVQLNEAVAEVEKLKAENERLRKELTQHQASSKYSYEAAAGVKGKLEQTSAILAGLQALLKGSV